MEIVKEYEQELKRPEHLENELELLWSSAKLISNKYIA